LGKMKSVTDTIQDDLRGVTVVEEVKGGQ
jgi:hypothetical protein